MDSESHIWNLSLIQNLLGFPKTSTVASAMYLLLKHLPLFPNLWLLSIYTFKSLKQGTAADWSGGVLNSAGPAGIPLM